MTLKKSKDPRFKIVEDKFGNSIRVRAAIYDEAWRELGPKAALNSARVGRLSYAIVKSYDHFIEAIGSTIIVRGTKRVHSTPSLMPEPPALAEIVLLLFAKTKYRDSIAITLSEDFERRLQNGYSVARARRLYWLSVVASLGPQMRALARRHGLKLLNWVGVAGLLGEVIHKLTH